MKFEIGASYSRRLDIHAKFLGQWQGGISTPKDGEFIFLFTGGIGRKHGYYDEFTEDGFDLYGEGQLGDMALTHGNLAVQTHALKGKRLLLFQSLGKGKRVVYRGEFRVISHRRKDNVPDTNNEPRSAIVFTLARVESDEVAVHERAERELLFSGVALSETTRRTFIDARTKQVLFRDRVEQLEKCCRLTGIADGRFLRASHIKPWAKCETGAERIDGHNGLLLAHHADHLFDKGWMTFEDTGRPRYSRFLPPSVTGALYLRATRLGGTTPFTAKQKSYLDFHRRFVFEKMQASLDASTLPPQLPSLGA